MSVDSWVGSYASAQNQFEKDFPTIAAMDLGILPRPAFREVFMRTARVWARVLHATVLLWECLQFVDICIHLRSKPDVSPAIQ